MKYASIEIGGRIRTAVQVPDSALRVDFSKSVCESIPVVIVGDSSRSANLTLGWELLRDMGYSGPFVADLLLINGTCNRYLRISVDRATERWTVDSVQAGKFEVSPALHERCNKMQAKYLTLADSNVLSEQESGALAWDLPLPQSKV